MKDYQIADGVMLSDIDPSKGSKYSPNLFRWLKKHCRRGQWHLTERDGVPWLVLWHDGFTSGAKLFGVLCNGSRERTADVTGMRFGTERFGFWQQYKAIGRCAIDTEHSVWFWDEDKRWEISEDGKTRKCLWCGKRTERMEEYEIREVKTRWVSVEVEA